MSGSNQFYLMHKNDIVTVVELDEISGSMTKIAPKVQRGLLPPGGNLSAENLRKWWQRRAVPVNQGNIKRILMEQGIPTTQNFLMRSLGLSLSDHYWVKPVGSGFSWEQVNLFTNDFKDEIGSLQFSLDSDHKEQKMIDFKGVTSFYPSSSVQGELKKRWIIKDGKRYLIKGNYGSSYQQSINEILAVQMHERQKKMPYTDYSLCQIPFNNGVGIGCICENFATEKVEFIPAYDVVCSAKKRNDLSEYEHFISVCTQHGLQEDEVRNFLEYQILSDFVITNTDRHFNNFGVLRDTDTLQFIGMAPIFDSGNSMFWNTPVPLDSDFRNISVNSFRKKEIDLLKYVRNRNLIHMDWLLSEKEVQKLLEKDANIENRIESILKGYQKKIELLDCFQKGENIWNK